MRHQAKSKFWFARPAGSYLFLLTAIYAACLTTSDLPRHESHAVKAKILLSKLSIESRPAETTQDLRTLLHDLLALEPAHAHSAPVVIAAVFLPPSQIAAIPESPSPHSLFERPPPSSIL